MTKPQWIAIDWGTTNLRGWAMSASGHLLAHAASDQGMGGLTASQFEPALLSLIGDWLGDGEIDVVACGMVGARQGWIEAPYIAVPARPIVGGVTLAPTTDPRLRVHIIPGMQQPRPADVMRGEETQILGYLSVHKDFDGILCLPGTHTKWVHISAEEVVSFQTYMTGELFSLLSNQSILRHSVQSHDMHGETFSEALDESLSHPERLASRLFAIRADTILHDLDATKARSRLSGLLLGAELAAARPYWLGQSVVIIGENKLANLYADALAAQGVAPNVVSADDVTLAGLKAAFAHIHTN